MPKKAANDNGMPFTGRVYYRDLVTVYGDDEAYQMLLAMERLAGIQQACSDTRPIDNDDDDALERRVADALAVIDITSFAH